MGEEECEDEGGGVCEREVGIGEDGDAISSFTDSYILVWRW